MKQALAILVVALTLAGCGTSPPTHFFTLAPVAPSGRSATAPAFPIKVAAVHIPAVLDRRQMVRQTGTNILSISGQDWWGAPFGEMTRNVLARDLAERLPTGSVILPQSPAPPSASLLVVNVARFGEAPNGRVRLDASWTLMRGRPAKPVLRREVNLEDKATGHNAASQAAAMSKLLGQLADHIAAEVTTSAAG